MTDPRRLTDFTGKWFLKRQIAARDGANASFEGTAVWAPANGGSNYAEQGYMTLHNQIPMQAERRYHWTADLSVYFEDGRFFHQVPREGGDATHLV